MESYWRRTETVRMANSIFFGKFPPFLKATTTSLCGCENGTGERTQYIVYVIIVDGHNIITSVARYDDDNDDDDVGTPSAFETVKIVQIQNCYHYYHFNVYVKHRYGPCAHHGRKYEY